MSAVSSPARAFEPPQSILTSDVEDEDGVLSNDGDAYVSPSHNIGEGTNLLDGADIVPLEEYPPEIGALYEQIPQWITPGPKQVAEKVNSERGLHPQGKAHLQVWFLTHLDHPYPTDADRLQLESMSGISDYQCMLWFSNTRRRNKKLLSVLDAQIKVLKSWFLKHLDNPHPSPEELQTLIKDTAASQEVVLDWLREARNLFRRFFTVFVAANRITKAGSSLHWIRTGVERTEPAVNPAIPEATPPTQEPVLLRVSRALPKSAVQVLNDWFEKHIHHPYPIADEQRSLVSQTGLTETQVLNWLANARRRSRRKAQLVTSNMPDDEIQTNRFPSTASLPAPPMMMHSYQQPLMPQRSLPVPMPVPSRGGMMYRGPQQHGQLHQPQYYNSPMLRDELDQRMYDQVRQQHQSQSHHPARQQDQYYSSDSRVGSLHMPTQSYGHSQREHESSFAPSQGRPMSMMLPPAPVGSNGLPSLSQHLSQFSPVPSSSQSMISSQGYRPQQLPSLSSQQYSPQQRALPPLSALGSMPPSLPSSSAFVGQSSQGIMPVGQGMTGPNLNHKRIVSARDTVPVSEAFAALAAVASMMTSSPGMDELSPHKRNKF